MSWPMQKNLPEPKMLPTYAPLARQPRSYDRHDTRGKWQLQAWREATGREDPMPVSGPLMPPDEVGRLMMALGKKTLKSLTLAS
jgi:hypothetical protein